MPFRRTRAEPRRPDRPAAARRPALLLSLALLLPLVSCAPAARPGSLAPTLVFEEHRGGRVAIQNGIPVPTFDAQTRRRIDLDGTWRVERMELSSDLSLTDRSASLEAILDEAAGREQPTLDDRSWQEIEVPGALNHPPDGEEVGGWYRRTFYVPLGWSGLAGTLKIGSANYVADVWVNGTHLGHHEGGYTPFAFDVTTHLRPAEINHVAIRVDNPAWGSRNDIVPWGLADWWNYGGLTGSVWIEATPPVHVVRADAVPHLDGVDVSVVVRNAAPAADEEDEDDPAATPTPTPTPSQAFTDEPEPDDASSPVLRIEVLPAEVTPDNLAAPTASAIVPAGALPLATDVLPLPELAEGDVATLDTGFLLGGVDRWSPASPALYVLRVTIQPGDGPSDEPSDELWTSFGLRHVGVESETAQLLLNGEPTMFAGVGLHDERIQPDGDGEASRAHRITEVDDLLVQLDHARAVNADLIRAGHTPANPLLLRLADRLGFAVWEEIPLYHYTPLTYGIAMDRGIPQQMLAEMALRDMNRPSVLFHGLSNESTGTDERQDALQELHDLDRELDGTRLTGQAAYGSSPEDPTHAPLDVAGFTFYYGVFYGAGADIGTPRAVREAHAAHPGKPILALEFGRWADGDGGAQRQAAIFEDTFPVFARRSSAESGYVGAAVWWTLEDFTTMVPGIAVEHFGLYEASGRRRPSADVATRWFSARSGGGDAQQIESGVDRAEVVRDVTGPDLRLLAYLGFGLAFSVGVLGAVLLVLLRRGGRAAPSVGGLRRGGRA